MQESSEIAKEWKTAGSKKGRARKHLLEYLKLPISTPTSWKNVSCVKMSPQPLCGYHTTFLDLLSPLLRHLQQARETPEPCACMYVLFFFTSVRVGMQIIYWALNIYCKVNLDCTCYSTLGYAMYMFDEGLYISLLSHRKEKNPWKHLKNKAYLLKHRGWHPLFHHLYILNCQFKYLVQWCILKTNEHS